MKEKPKILLRAFLLLGVFLMLGLFSIPAAATTGVNQELSFEGKIVNGSGINVADNTYNMEFKIYTAAGGCNPSTGSGCTLGWTEDWLVSNSQGVSTTSGTFEVNLDSVAANNFSGINFNTYPLYLSMQIGSTSSCTPSGNFQTNCGGDGEMKPYILLTASPYALNSNALGGLTSSQFVQLAQGVQTDSSTSSSIYINKTGGSGSLLQLQAGGTDVLDLGYGGAVTVHTTGSDSTSALQVQNHSSSSIFDVDTANGRVGIGIASPNQPLEVSSNAPSGIDNAIVKVDGTISDASHYQSGLYSTPLVSVSSASTQEYSAIKSVSASSSSNLSGALLTGLFGGVYYNPGTAQTLGNAYGLHIQNYTGSSTAVITNSYGAWLQNPSKTAGSTITNDYGMYIENQTQGGTINSNLNIGGLPASGNYSIYNSSAYQNYFAGNLGIGVTVPGVALDATGSGRFSTSVLTPSVDTNSAVTLSLGTTNASAITLGNGTNNMLTTINGTTLVKPTSSHDSTTAFQVQSAGSSVVLNVDTTNSQVSLKNLNNSAVISSTELFTTSESLANPTSGWTSISGTGQTATATHTSGGGNTGIGANPAMTITAGAIYQITYTVSGMINGFITSKIGGATATNSVSTNTTEVDIITASGTGNLQFNPSNLFDGTISNISVKQVTTVASASLVVDDSTGTDATELRVSTAANGNLGLGINNLLGDSTGQFNVAIGANALTSTTTSSQNTAVGYEALQPTSASNNTAVGYLALGSDTTGSGNAALGASALKAVSTGSNDVAVGYNAGSANSSGDILTLNSIQNATMVGYRSQATCSNCVILGGQGGDQASVGIGTPNPTNFLSVEPNQMNSGTVSTHGTTTVDTLSSGSFITSAAVGSEIYIASSSSVTPTYKGTIQTINSATSITVSPAVTFSATLAHYYILYPGFQVTSTGAVYTQGSSTTQFQIQNNSGTVIFNADTVNSRIYIGATSAGATGTLLMLSNKNTSGDPTGLVGAMYYNSNSGTFRCDEGNRGWQDCLGVPKPNTRRWAYIQYPGTGIVYSAVGDAATQNASSTSAITATTSEPSGIDFATNTTSGNVVSLSGNIMYNSSNNPTYQGYIAMGSTSNIRLWFGLTNQTAATMGASANPAGNYAAFRYDTSVPDANYQCITKDGTTQTVTNSNIAADTNGHKFEIDILSGTSVEFKVDNVVVCTNTTHLPSTATLLGYVHSATTLTTSVLHFRVSWVYVESTK